MKKQPRMFQPYSEQSRQERFNKSFELALGIVALGVAIALTLLLTGPVKTVDEISRSILNDKTLTDAQRSQVLSAANHMLQNDPSLVQRPDEWEAKIEQLVVGTRN